MLFSYYSQKLLKLSGVLIKNIYDDNSTSIIEIQMQRKPHCFPCCGHITQSIHDYRLQPVKDIPSFGNKVLLLIRKRRYVCKECGKRFYEAINFLPRYYRHTKRLAFYILQQLSSTHSFKSIASAVNLSITTIIRIFDNLSYSPTSLPNRYKADLTSYLLKFDTSNTTLLNNLQKKL